MNAILLLILFKISIKPTHSENDALISIDLDLSGELSPYIVKNENKNKNILSFEIVEDKLDEMKIGRVIVDKQLICRDSPRLIERIVDYVSNDSYYNTVILITNFFFINGSKVLRVYEFIRPSYSRIFTKLIREPVPLDLKLNARRSRIIEPTPHETKVKVNFEIPMAYRSQYVIGDVKYGSVMVSKHNPNDIFKSVKIWASLDEKVIIQTIRITRFCTLIRSRCSLVIHNNSGFCRHMYTNSTPFV